MALAYQRPGPSTNIYDPEFTTSVQITRRTLEEASGTYGFDGQDNIIGGRESSDEEWAFRIQSEYLTKALQVIEDARIAMLLDEGLEVNHPSLAVTVVPAENLDISDSQSASSEPTNTTSPTEDHLESDIDLSPTPNTPGESIDLPDNSGPPTPGPASSSSPNDTRALIQDDIFNVDEGIRKDKGKGREESDDSIIPNQPIFADETSSQNNDEDVSKVSADKGKERNSVEDSISDDEKYALKVQAEDLNTALQIMEDAHFAKTLDEGAEARHPSLKQPINGNQVAFALRQAALSVAAKKGLPGPSSLRHELGPSFGLTPPSTKLHVDILENFTSYFVTPECTLYTETSLKAQLPYIERTESPVKPPPIVAAEEDNSSKPPSQEQDLPLQSICIVCEDPVATTNAIHTPCNHDYCKDCIISYVNASTRDSSLLPVRCCSLPIPKKSIIAFLDGTLLSFLESKSHELEVETKHRIYCQGRNCSTFLGSSQNLEGYVACPKCGSSTCASCKQLSHVGESCSDNAGILEVRALARVEQWQTCPGCNAIVELRQGCYHMTCLCATQFCYLCAKRWKTCTCPQFAEERL